MSGHSATTVLTGNPTRNTGSFTACNRLRDDWHVAWAALTASASPTTLWRISTARYSEDGPRITCASWKFPASEEDTVIPVSLIEHAMANDIKVHDETIGFWGLDVARQGNDSSVLCKRQGPVIHPLTVWRNLDLMRLTGVIKAEWDNATP